jgi:hypothetical protein
MQVNLKVTEAETAAVVKFIDEFGDEDNVYRRATEMTDEVWEVAMKALSEIHSFATAIKTAGSHDAFFLIHLKALILNEIAPMVPGELGSWEDFEEWTEADTILRDAERTSDMRFSSDGERQAFFRAQVEILGESDFWETF